MKIVLKQFDEPDILTLDDSQLDNDNFFDLIVESPGQVTIGITVSIDDLASAIKAFQEKQRLNYERDKRAE